MTKIQQFLADLPEEKKSTGHRTKRIKRYIE